MPTLKVKHRTDPGYYAKTGLQKYHDDEAIPTLINYCFDPKKTDNALIGGMAVDVQDAIFEMTALSKAYGKDYGLRLRHMILAFSPMEVISMGSCDLDLMQSIAEWAISLYGWRYQIVYSIHLDTENPHIHFVMNTTSYLDGTKYHGDMADYFGFRDHLESYVLPKYGFRIEVVSDAAPKKWFQ